CLITPFKELVLKLQSERVIFFHFAKIVIIFSIKLFTFSFFRINTLLSNLKSCLMCSDVVFFSKIQGLKCRIIDVFSSSESFLFSVTGFYGSNISNNYILDIEENEVTLDVSSYPQGLYSIALIVNGEVQDTITLIKQ